MQRFDLPQLSYPEFEPTKTTLHLWSQIVGKMRLKHTAHKNHWWNVTLYASVRGLRTGPMRSDDHFFEIEFDFIDDVLRVQTDTGDERCMELHDGLSVAKFYTDLMRELRELRVDASILAEPYGIPIATPFADDNEHAAYRADLVRRWWRIVLWSSGVMDEYQSPFYGKASPAHVFWHSFDLASARFSGRRAPARAFSNHVEADAYSHEVISCGFWSGDPNTAEPAYYMYVAPEPAGVERLPLVDGAKWAPSGAGHLATFPYEVVRGSADPRGTLLSFFNSGYEVMAKAAGWDIAALSMT